MNIPNPNDHYGRVLEVIDERIKETEFGSPVHKELVASRAIMISFMMGGAE